MIAIWEQPWSPDLDRVVKGSGAVAKTALPPILLLKVEVLSISDFEVILIENNFFSIWVYRVSQNTSLLVRNTRESLCFPPLQHGEHDHEKLKLVFETKNSHLVVTSTTQELIFLPHLSLV